MGAFPQPTEARGVGNYETIVLHYRGEDQDFVTIADRRKRSGVASAEINPTRFCVTTLASLSVCSLFRVTGTVYSGSVAKVAENPNYFISAARANPVIDEMTARVQHRPAKIETSRAARRGLQNVLARKRMGSVILYTWALYSWR